MIYIQKGLKTKHLTPIINPNNSDFINFCNLDIQTYNNNEDIKKIKTETAKYCLCGEVKNNIRKNENIINRTLIFIDYDDLKLTNDDFISIIRKKLEKYSYILYPTISHTINKPRYRLVLESSRPINNKEEYKATIEEITNKIGIKFDNTSETWSQIQGLPICNEKEKENYKIIKHIGIMSYTPVVPIPQNKPIIKDNTLSDTKLQQTNLNLKKVFLEHSKAIDIFEKYINNDKNNLQTRNNYISVIMVLAKSVQQNIITLETALQCAELLAFNNQKWIEQNKIDLVREISNPNIRTEYTFLNKFIVWNYEKPKTTKELIKLLSDIGNNERTKNAILDKNGNIKYGILSYSQVVNILLKHCYFINLGYTDYDDKSQLHIYNLDSGLYTSSDIFIDRIIDSIDSDFNKNFRNEVKQKLRMKAPFKEYFNDRYLIPVQNGIFDLKTKKLLPFSPKYPITTKIVTEYTTNAQKPSYFDFDKWLSSIACNDVEVERLLWEIINESVNANYTRGKFAILVGEGNNGKGTFQQMLVNLIGSKNQGTVSPQDFEKRFALSNLLNKIVNIADDISSEYLNNPSYLKSITTGEWITIEEKNVNPISVNLKIFNLFSCNDIPRIRDRTDGIYRRMLIVPFNANFNGKENKTIKNYYLADKKVLEYILFKALNLDFEEFTIPKVCIEMLDEYKKDNDYITAYIIDEYIENKCHDIERVPVQVIKDNIDIFLQNNKITQHIPRNIGKIFIKILQKNTNNKYTLGRYKIRNEDYLDLINKGLINQYINIEEKYKNKTHHCIFKDI